MKKNRVGLTPIPTDANVEYFLQELSGDNHEKLINVLEDLRRTLAQTQEAGEPTIFAYGKLLNFLAANKKPDMVRLLAAALWELV